MQMLMNDGDGLGTQAMPQKQVVILAWLDGVIDASQELVVVFYGGEGRVWPLDLI